MADETTQNEAPEGLSDEKIQELYDHMQQRKAADAEAARKSIDEAMRPVLTDDFTDELITKLNALQATMENQDVREVKVYVNNALLGLNGLRNWLNKRSAS